MDVKRMHCMIEKLAECAEKQFEAGIENIDTAEMGQVTDMLKDLAEAMYYRTLTKAMDESEDDEIMDMFDRYGDGRRYYDHYRYADGRFAPKGRGMYRRGYEDYFYAEDFNRIEENLETINKHVFTQDIGKTKTFYDNGQFIKYDELNRLIDGMYTLTDMLKNQMKNRRKLEIRLGNMKGVKC